MKYITILDFEVGKVFQYNIGVDMKTSYKKYKHWNPDSECCEEYLTGKGHNLKNCEWMVHSDPKIITK